MDRIVGFTALRGLDPSAVLRVRAAEQRMLDALPWLRTAELTVGETSLRIWGHGDPAAAAHRMSGGDVVVVAGQPVPPPRPHELEGWAGEVPWEGRLLVLAIDAAGRRWRAANDWSGSLPAFHAPAGAGRILSTLEPAAVAGAGLGTRDIAPSGVVSLLVHGYFLGERTLYEPLRALAADTIVEWDERGVATRPQRSLRPSDERWQDGWDTLAEGLHERTVAALRRSLATSPRWRLPLSGGLDSRLIAAVAHDEGIEVDAFTYGDDHWADVRFARRVAAMLGIPWRHVRLGRDYLARHSPTWGATFGTSLHFHGMYQYPLLESMGSPGPPISTGYTGDPMGGAQTAAMLAGDRSPRRRLIDKWHMWSEEELTTLLRFDPSDALDELDAEIDGQVAALDGPLYQRLWIVFQHNHVARFSSYQPALYDQWAGVGVPFVDRELAQYTLSLPRAVLDDRRLQLDGFRRAYPALATIPGTWSSEPVQPTGRWYVRRTLADLLPDRLHRGPLAEFAPARNTADQEALAATGDGAVWPVRESWTALGDWLDRGMVERALAQARAGDLGAMARLEAVQALAWALLP